MELESKDWQQINGCLLRLYRELEPQKQIQAMLGVVNELVPDGCVAMDSFDTITKQQLIAGTLPANFGTAEDKQWIGRYIHQSPLAAYFAATPDPEWKTITDFMPLEDFQKTELHRFGFSRLNVNHQILGLLAHVHPMIHIVSVNRTERGFTEKERVLLNTIHPHLVTSFLNAQAFSQTQNSLEQLKSTMNAAPGAYGYFMTDKKLSWLQPRAQEWLSAFFTGEVRSIAGLPQSICHLIDRADGSPLHLEDRNTTHRLTVCVLPSVLGGWILRLEQKPLVATPYFRPLAKLSPAENGVLRWMVEGKRNAEIATILGVSPRTAEKHVSQILTKLDVENRATAIVRAMELAGMVGSIAP